MLDAVSVLEHRLGFLEGIDQIAHACNWPAEEVGELHYYVLDELIRIDNLILEMYKRTGKQSVADQVWEEKIEDLRYNLSLILGVKLRFI